MEIDPGGVGKGYAVDRMVEGALLGVIEAVYCLKFSPSAPEQR